MQNSPKKPQQNIVTRIILVTLGSALFSFNVNTFVHTAGLFPGGFAGIALLLQAVCERFFGFHLPYAPVSLLLNAFPVYISFRFIGRKFTLLSCLSILLTSILTDVLPGVQITSEPVLVSIFGGMINGTAIGLCLLAGATSGGTDFISIYLSEQHGKDSFNLILGLNAVVLSLAGLFFGWERALYSIVFQFVTTQVIHLVYRRYQQVTLLIVTDRMPLGDHDHSLIAAQLGRAVEILGCSGVLLDFEEPGKNELAGLASVLTSALPCPVVVSDVYAQAIDCPVFLSPCPHHIHLSDHMAPWMGREIWLDLARDAETITVTAEGSVVSPLPGYDLPEGGHRDEDLHCHYWAEVKANSVRFTLWRTAADLEALARAAEGLGIRTFVGLWQELA